MRCPYCGFSLQAFAGTTIIESRSCEAGAAVRRRRECPDCKRRFTTYERAAPVEAVEDESLPALAAGFWGS